MSCLLRIQSVDLFGLIYSITFDRVIVNVKKNLSHFRMKCPIQVTQTPEIDCIPFCFLSLYTFTLFRDLRRVRQKQNQMINRSMQTHSHAAMCQQQTIKDAINS